MSISDSDGNSDKNIRAELRRTVEAKRAQITAQNETERAERNSRRWREQRTPEERERQRVSQRAAYAAQIADEEGRAVRDYAPVPGKTPAEREANERLRHAEKERARRANADQAEKDREADRKWVARQRKKGWTDEQIAQGLAKRAADRHYRQPEPIAYADNPNFGQF